MNISKYIKELIIKNECIILPGFGGFETHYKPACIDTSTGNMVPPSKQIVFRQDYTKDNGVLLRFFAEKEGIVRDKAKAVIDDFIADIVYKIDMEGTYKLDGLGTFVKLPDGKLVFKPLEKENFLVDSYGLSEISIPAADRPDKQSFTADQSAQVSEGKSPARILFLVALISVLLSAAIILVHKAGLPGKIRQLITGSEIRSDQTQEKIVFGHREETDDSDSMTGVINARIDESTEKERALLYTEQIREETAKPEITGISYHEEEKRYFIVAGSFKAESQAVDLSRQLNNKGFKSEIIRTDNELYRVVLDTFDEISEAIDGLEYYRKQLSNEIWIVRI